MHFRRNKKHKRDVALGIDLGASQIKAAVVRRLKDKLELVEYAVRSLPPGLTKAYKGPEFAAELQQLVDGLKTSERHAFVTISCSSAMVCQAEFPPVPLAEIKSALKLNSSGYLRRDFSAYYLDAFELKKGTEETKSKAKSKDKVPDKDKDSDKAKDAANAKDAPKAKDSTKTSVLVGGATKEEVDACRDALVAAKIKPEVIELTAVSVVNAFQVGRPQSQNEVVVLIDIGARMTSINFLLDGMPLITRIMHFGGAQLSDYISQVLVLKLDEAEEEKRRYGQSGRRRCLLVQHIMGPNDPNYKNPNFFPPNGPWRRLKAPSVRFVGVASSSQQQNGHKGGIVHIGAGSPRDNNHPCIWLSATAGYLYFENLGCFYPGRGIVIGEASNHDRSGTGSVSGEYFENVGSGSSNIAGLGPTVDITGRSFWLWFDHCTFEGNYKNGVKDNKRAAILMDGIGNNGVGLTYFTNLNLNGGGVKYLPGASSGPIDIRVLTEEGNYTESIPPAVWITSTRGSLFHLSQVLVADPGPDAPPAIEIDSGNPNDVLVDTASASNGAPNVEGPATVLNQYSGMLLNQTISPIQQGQDGFFNYHVIGQIDAARRGFGPTVVRFPNLAPQIPSSWIKSAACGSVDLIDGVTGPDGTKNAAGPRPLVPRRLSAIDFYQRSHNISVGDSIIAGVWVRSATRNGFAGSTTQPISAEFTGVKYSG